MLSREEVELYRRDGYLPGRRLLSAAEAERLRDDCLRTCAEPLEPVLANEDGVGVSAPLTHQGRAGLEHDTGIEGRAGFLELSGQGLQATLQRPACPATGALLELIGEGSHQQIATEALRRFAAMQLTPGKPQVARRPIDQFGYFAFDLGQARLSCSVVLVVTSTGNGRRPARVLASRSVVDWRFHALAGPAMR